MFRQAGGVLCTSQVLAAGVHPRDLYALRDAGALERLSRGVYRLADLPPLADPDLVTVAARVPKAVIALVSALHFHGLGTEIPHEVHVALPPGTTRPKLDWPPLRSGLEDWVFTPAEFLRNARICRVDRIVRPYLEALQ